MFEIPRVLRLWFAFEGDVDRATYLTHGVALMLVKYVVDATLIGATTGIWWAPWDYTTSVPLVSGRILPLAPTWLGPLLLAWTLPFLWVGVTLTMRRLVHAGWSPWLSVLFFVPLLGYLLMVALAILPERSLAGREPERHPTRDAAGSESSLPPALLAVVCGAAVGVAMLYLGIMMVQGYGFALFLGAPFGVGVVTGYLRSRGGARSAKDVDLASMGAALLCFVAALALGIEGAICLLLFGPLGLIVVAMGGRLGRAIERSGGRQLHGVFALALLPFMTVLEPPIEVAPLREVTTSIEIEASADAVWRTVVAFPRLREPAELMFRLGIAYPVSARIEGAGVGAVRYCVFSTGAFVEPITVWEPGRRLGFDVVASPPPLRELTPYRIDPPHMEGYLVPRKGEFRIVELGEGRVRLEGTTWYEQRLRPIAYWAVSSDWIIGAIHERVLEHIARVAEAA